ncbi:MAG: hypothetical protein INH37_22735 [Myxococcaceae bacterium]|nr:hypothetical protein [Myxococcaceae bacterium]
MTLRGLVWSLLVVRLLGAVQALAGEPLNELRPGLQSLRQGELARLEKALRPLAEQPLYRADLTIDVAARKIVGQVSLRWTVRGEPLTEVVLQTAPNATHADALMLLSATVNGHAAELDHPDPTRTRVKLPAEALVGAVVELAVRLEARVPPLPATGVAVADHAAFSAAPDFMSLVGLLPMVSSSPSNFLVSVSVPRGYTVVMPGIALGEVPEQRTRVRFTNAVVGSRAFPLFVTRSLEKVSADAGGIGVEAWVTRPEPRSKVVLEHAVFAARELDRVLGPYPFRTLRLVEVPFDGGRRRHGVSGARDGVDDADVEHHRAGRHPRPPQPERPRGTRIPRSGARAAAAVGTRNSKREMGVGREYLAVKSGTYSADSWV